MKSIRENLRAISSLTTGAKFSILDTPYVEDLLDFMDRGRKIGLVVFDNHLWEKELIRRMMGYGGLWIFVISRAKIEVMVPETGYSETVVNSAQINNFQFFLLKKAIEKMFGT